VVWLIIWVVCVSVCNVGVLCLKDLNGSSWFLVGGLGLMHRTATYFVWVRTRPRKGDFPRRWHIGLGKFSANCYLFSFPLPSNGHHRSNDDCLAGKTENYQVCSAQYCVQHYCAQCNAHTWTFLTVVCWLVYLFCGYIVCYSLCVKFRFLGLFCVIVHLYMAVCFCRVRFSFFSSMPRNWLGRSPKWPILCRVGRKTLT